MKLFKLHLRPAIQPYLLFITIQSVCSAGLIYARQFYHHHAIAVNTLQQRLSSLKTQEMTWYQQQTLLTDYLPQYQHLLQSGLIREDYSAQQLKMNTALRLQQLKTIQQAHALFPINYSISIAPTHQTPFNNVQTTFSAMHIEMGLLHEEDLLTLLNRLKNSRHGRFMARSCKISQLSPNDQDMQQFKPHLQATCELGWISVPSLARLQTTP